MSQERGDGVETVSFRIPTSLRSAVDAAAELRHETATAVFRAALEEYLAPARRRVHELPGFTKRLDDFLTDLAKRPGKQAVLFIVEERSGRHVYDGILDAENTGDSLVALRNGEDTYVLPRAHVVAWEGGEAATINRLAIALRRSGYAVETTVRLPR
jgi:hypothetical protein